MALADLPVTLCRKGTPALAASDCAEYLRELPQWTCVQENGVTMLQREFGFADFAAALAFTNAVAALAEAANHHPRLITEWGKVAVSWWTHTVNGLHHNDFIMAARCDRVFAPQTPDPSAP